jgi:hypothetical protein
MSIREIEKASENEEEGKDSTRGERDEMGETERRESRQARSDDVIMSKGVLPVDRTMLSFEPVL